MAFTDRTDEQKDSPEQLAAGFRADNADVLDRRVRDTLKAGRPENPKVLKALTDLAGTYSTEMASYINGATRRGSPGTSEVTISRGSRGPEYSYDRRGNRTGVLRESIPGTTETREYGGANPLGGTRVGLQREESGLTSSEFERFRSGEAATQNAITGARQTGLLYAPGGIKDRELALKGLDLERKRTGADKFRNSQFISDAEKLLANRGVIDARTRELNPGTVTLQDYDLLDTLASDYGIAPQNAYRYFGLPDRTLVEQFKASMEGPALAPVSEQVDWNKYYTQ